MWGFFGLFVGAIVSLVVTIFFTKQIKVGEQEQSESRQTFIVDVDEEEERKLKEERERKLKEEEEERKLKEEEERKLKEEEERKLKEEKERKLKEAEAAKERREEKRKKSPVCPRSKKCQNEQCDHPSQTVCSNCYVHLCSKCHKTDDKCSLCKRQGTMQKFESNCLICDAEASEGSQYDFYCFLNTCKCKQIFHKQCLLKWCEKEEKCLHCREKFDRENISTDFFDPEAHY